MIEIFSKKAGLVVRDIFFATGVVPSNVNRDIDLYTQCSSPIYDSVPSCILTIDLTKDENTIFQGFGKNNRYKIRRATDKDGLIFNIDFTPTVDFLEFFKEFYNNFAKSKGLPLANPAKLEALRNSGNFSIASVHSKNLPIAMSSFISDGYRVYFHQAATVPRDGNNSVLISTANRLLHWQMMLTMKKLDVKVYVLGNILRNPKFQSVNDFKREFGGVECETYNFTHGVSWLGKFALKTSSLLRKL